MTPEQSAPSSKGKTMSDVKMTRKHWRALHQVRGSIEVQCHEARLRAERETDIEKRADIGKLIDALRGWQQRLAEVAAHIEQQMENDA